ncbi:MAG: nucleotide-binding protein [Phycisphaerales bacterium]|nr:nucleotide-binding protein [Phycisphaerales bacterium]
MKDPELQVQMLIEKARIAQKVVVCVGAGASYPWIDDAVRADDSAFFEWNSAHFLKSRAPSELDIILTKLPAAAIITTNFDPMIEEAFIAEGKRPAVLIDDNDLRLLDRNAVPIFKLRGTIDRPLRLVSPFSKHVSHRAEFDAYLRTLFQSSLTFFIGFSVHDGTFREIFEEYRGSTDIATDWVVIENQDNALTKHLWESRGVQLLDMDFDEIPTFLNAIAKRLQQRRAAPVIAKSNRIFVVHSGNYRFLDDVREAVEPSGFEIVAFEDEVGSGLTLFERFRRLADSSECAIVLLTPEVSRLPKQNTVFELGYLVGKLGVNRVLVVMPSFEVDVPSDLTGHMFVVADPENPRKLGARVVRWLSEVVRS